MRDTISEQFFSAMDGIVPVFLSEAETEVYPYAVYRSTVSTRYTKDGPNSAYSVLTCDVYGKDYDECYGIADAINDAVEEKMNTDEFHSQLYECTASCTGGTWDITMTFHIKQALQWQ